MAVVSKASATWSGGLESGSGTTTLASSKLGTFNVNWKARSAGEASTTTPEELLGAAHAACYCMAMSHTLGGLSLEASAIDASAAVTFEPGKGITSIVLDVSAVVPGIDQERFEQIAADVKAACPVSQALAGVAISLGEVVLRAA